MFTLITARLSAGDPQDTFSLSALWSDIKYGLSWFFGNLSPAALWAVVAFAICVAFFVYYWLCLRPRPHDLEWIAMAEKKAKPRRMTLSLKRHPFTKKDVFPMLLVTVIYAATAFFQLGDFSAPQTYTKFQDGDVISFSYDELVTVDKLSYYTSLGTGSYVLEYSTDGEQWYSVTLNQKYSSLFKWEIIDLTAAEEGEEAAGPITASRFRICAGDVPRYEGLWLAELALWSDGAPLMPDRVDNTGLALFDEPEEWTTKYTYMNSTYFDEIYHPRTALEHLENIYPYEVSHPPLGKLILSIGIWLFGMVPFGWRFMGTLFGVLMLPILYIFLKNMFGKSAVAFCGTCLFAFDFMHLVQTRIATIDTYGVFFILVSYYFMYRWLTVPAGEKLRKSVPSLFLAGLFWGIGCASKWTVIYAGVGLAVLWLLGLIFKGREWPKSRKKSKQQYPRFSRHVLGTIGLSVLFFVVVPVCIYLLSYIPYATAAAARDNTPTTMQSFLKLVWDNQVFMLTYHQGVHTPHPYSSAWYQWIVDGRPILYYRDLDYSQTEGVKSLFASFNNPMVSWTGLMAFVALIIQAIRRKSGRALFIIIAVLSQFVPWLGIGRILFAYHYFPTILFLVFAIAYLMNDILSRRRTGCKLAVYGFTGVTVAIYALFYPALIGLYIPLWYSDALLRWFPSWPL